MWFALLFLPFFIIAQELEVQLSTRNPATPVYLTNLRVPSAEYDWRYFEELRGALAFDLNTNGFALVLPVNEEYEKRMKWPEVKSDFNVTQWKRDHVSYVLAIQVFQNRFQLIAFDIEKGTSKKYRDFPLTGRIEEDRRQIHTLADALQKDLFGIEGIASLKILYSQRQKEGDEWNSEIWICDSDGANPRRILSEKGYCLSPGFFPSSVAKDDFYYVSFQQGQSKIYRSSVNQTSGELMISLRGSQALPALNKKGNQMAFITDVAGRPDLFIQNLDGKGEMSGKARQLYSAPRATQASPTFSPDGKRIAFVSDKDGPPRIYVLDIAGPKNTQRPVPRLLTKKNRENTSPAWSPDGNKLAYSAKVDSVRQIWIYDFTTEQELSITSGPENKENPSWAPDSLHLVYNTESEDICELYLIHLNQGEPILISKGSQQNRFPCFEPR